MPASAPATSPTPTLAPTSRSSACSARPGGSADDDEDARLEHLRPNERLLRLAVRRRGDALEFNVAGYYSAQNKLTRLDLGLIDLQVGPRFLIPNDTIRNLSIRPYGIASYTALGGSTYFMGPWRRRDRRHDLGSFATVEHFGEYRRKTYENSTDYPLATQQTGNLWSYALQATGTVTGNLKYVGRFTLSNNVAATTFNSFDQFAVDVAFPYEFAGRDGGRWPGPWIVSPTVGFSNTRYGDPIRRSIPMTPGTTRSGVSVCASTFPSSPASGS